MEEKSVTLDEVVMDLVCIMELTYLFYNVTDNRLYPSIYNNLKQYIQKFYEECYLLNRNLLDDLLFYVISIIKAHNEDVVLKSLAIQLKCYVEAVKNDGYFEEKGLNVK